MAKAIKYNSSARNFAEELLDNSVNLGLDNRDFLAISALLTDFLSKYSPNLVFMLSQILLLDIVIIIEKFFILNTAMKQLSLNDYTAISKRFRELITKNISIK